MALFSRRNRSSDGDTVRLASADNSWWLGSTAPSGGDEVAGAGSLEVRWADDGPDVAPDSPDGASPGADGAGSGSREDLAAGIAEALEEYGYGSAGRPGPSSSPIGPTPLDEASIFVHDGLPSEDHLPDLLGALGLEGDADWVDIARAHRRLTTDRGGRAGGDDQCQVRAANEAYACLRLFHH